ncbi:MAG: hypothetical protein JRJ42_10480 [Deltaproteobacteria bacterium]|nr:hypothetical protein [Deltaproteobacteria bacterium]
MAFDSQNRIICPVCLEPAGEPISIFYGRLVCCQCGCVFPDRSRSKSDISDIKTRYTVKDFKSGQKEYWNNYIKRLRGSVFRQQGDDRFKVVFHFGPISTGLSQEFEANGWRVISLLHSTRPLHQQYSGPVRTKTYNNNLFLRDLYTMELVGCADLAICHPEGNWIDTPRKIKEIVLLVLATGGLFSLVVPRAFSYASEGDFIAAKEETSYPEEILYTEEAVRRLLWPEFKIVSQKKFFLEKRLIDKSPMFVKDDPRLAQTQQEILATHLHIEAVKI